MIALILILYFVPMIIALARGCDEKGRDHFRQPARWVVSSCRTVVCLIWSLRASNRQKQWQKAQVLTCRHTWRCCPACRRRSPFEDEPRDWVQRHLLKPVTSSPVDFDKLEARDIFKDGPLNAAIERTRYL